VCPRIAAQENRLVEVGGGLKPFALLNLDFDDCPCIEFAGLKTVFAHGLVDPETR
jgi:hypothetical protein